MYKVLALYIGYSKSSIKVVIVIAIIIKTMGMIVLSQVVTSFCELPIEHHSSFI